jgi:Zn finger protein HypA/HybF involved in hydrogenase expression
MACLEIHCSDCDHVEFTNIPLKACPKCRCQVVSVLWDEDVADHETSDFDLETTDWEE